MSVRLGVVVTDLYQLQLPEIAEYLAVLKQSDPSTEGKGQKAKRSWTSM